MVTAPPTLRPMRVSDVDAVDALAVRTFADLELRLGQARPGPPRDPEGLVAALGRIRHLVEHDPEGAWIAERADELVGAALALVREGLWGLSLLVVAPGLQSGGVGSRLLGKALVYGQAARGGVILASEDPRALRLYARAGFALHPALEASGRPRPRPAPDGVRAGGPEDLPLTETVDRAVRGAAHGPDVLAALEQGYRMLVAPGRGYALMRERDLRLLAAVDEDAAQDLLRAALASVPEGEPAMVDWVTSAQQWALPVLLEAGLSLRTGGAVFLRGEVGPFAPYLPSGAYL